MTKDILVFGMKRSGHHAIIEWLMKRIPYKVTFKNCIAQFKPIPNDFDQIANKNSDSLIRIANYEDPDLSEYSQHSRDVNVQRILVLRDPYNLMASRKNVDSSAIHMKGERYVSLTESIYLWKQHAKEALSPKYIYPYTILFNQWFSDSSYRFQICKDLGLMLNDNPLKNVPTYGGGSSFDGCSFMGKAQEMNVLNRFQKYINDKKFMKLFDEECTELNKKLFNFKIKPKKSKPKKSKQVNDRFKKRLKSFKKPS
jgi:hypothetical protein